ncbi:hypothetical protein F4810DRAFT_708701 [Camillea tinctor]|nr:hypothetical protein F4810DRAFT_708701 [Camillea tinctor]
MYPDAKILLNQRRDPTTCAQSFNEGVMFFLSQLRARFQRNQDWLEDAYVLHNQWVRDEAARRGRPVLEWMPDNGWEPLCELLVVPVPNMPFPHNNERTNL